MTKLLPAAFGPPSSVFGDDTSNDKLSTGITVGYPILRIKGKVWAITRGGNEPHVLMRPDGDGPRNSIDVVLLAASQHVSKVWYEKGFEEGSTAPPDCFSANGIVPDAASTKKQNNTCGGCPRNAWGSRITPAGKKAKACNDSKRVAVAPLGDIRNEAFGGPMMLRVPAASLADLANYGDGMAARGYPYYSIGTKMSFDSAEAYPKLVFEPVRKLEDDEAVAVLELRESLAVQAILAEDIGTAAEAPVEPGPVEPDTPKVTAPPPSSEPVAPVMRSDGFGGAAPAKATSPTSPKPTKRVQSPSPPPQPSKQPPALEKEVAAAGGSFEDTLDEQIENLLPGAVA